MNHNKIEIVIYVRENGDSFFAISPTLILKEGFSHGDEVLWFFTGRQIFFQKAI